MIKIVSIISILTILYSCQINEYECVCYYQDNDKVSYDKYIVKNKKLDAEKYCNSISGNGKTCVITK
jgi:hypothetical protein